MALPALLARVKPNVMCGLTPRLLLSDCAAACALLLCKVLGAASHALEAQRRRLVNGMDSGRNMRHHLV